MPEMTTAAPSHVLSARELFGLDTDLTVRAFREPVDHVPDVDHAYRFDHAVTTALLAGFDRNRRVMVQGLHGTGKSTHIEQVAARLNWPCVRVNLDGHLSRLDLIGRDAVVLRDGKQVTEFQEASCPGRCSVPSPSSSTSTTPAAPTSCSSSSASSNATANSPCSTRTGCCLRIRRSGCSPPPTRSDWATSTGCITVRSGSITRRSTAGTSSRRSIISPRNRRSRSCPRGCRPWGGR